MLSPVIYLTILGPFITIFHHFFDILHHCYLIYLDDLGVIFLPFVHSLLRMIFPLIKRIKAVKISTDLKYLIYEILLELFKGLKIKAKFHKNGFKCFFFGVCGQLCVHFFENLRFLHILNVYLRIFAHISEPQVRSGCAGVGGLSLHLKVPPLPFEYSFRLDSISET